MVTGRLKFICDLGRGGTFIFNVRGVVWKWRRSDFLVGIFHYIFYLTVEGKADGINEGHAYVLVVAEPGDRGRSYVTHPS